MTEGVQSVAWHPIATAPRDGSQILVCVTQNLGSGEWQTMFWVDYRLGDEIVWPVYRARIDLPFPPSHWMDLPPEPGAGAVHATPPEAVARIERLEAEIADLKSSVIAFAGPHAARWAAEGGLPDSHLHPTHYDILKKAGADMTGFTRATLNNGGGE